MARRITPNTATAAAISAAAASAGMPRGQQRLTAAQHSEAARAHAKLAAQHSAQAATLARDAQRERPRRSR